MPGYWTFSFTEAVVVPGSGTTYVTRNLKYDGTTLTEPLGTANIYYTGSADSSSFNVTFHYVNSTKYYEVGGSSNGTFSINTRDGPTGTLTQGSGSLIGYTDTSSTTNSNICFVAGTPVLTDQGSVSIERIDPLINTINGCRIVTVTKSVSTESHIICIRKDALGVALPSQDTYVSQLHKILYNGCMVKAMDLPFTEKVVYNGQLLYNVLLEQDGTMIVNNLVAETLNVKNNVAILYRHIVDNKLGLEEENRLVELLNKKMEQVNDFRKAFFSNIVFLITLDLLRLEGVKVPVTTESIIEAFFKQPIVV